jgi:hypothetical protein
MASADKIDADRRPLMPLADRPMHPFDRALMFALRIRA